MFSGCSSLKKLNLSNFNTVNVINMSGMFNSCSSLNEINISYFDIKNATIWWECFIDAQMNLKIKLEVNSKISIMMPLKRHFIEQNYIY